MTEVGRELAAGRDGKIFEFGPGRVLRRTSRERSLAYEANVMELARGFGVPVPRVHELRANDTELVMDRIDGPSMLDWMLKGPWRMRAGAQILGELHDAVHKIPANSWLHDAGDGGDRLVHLDLHPLNVMMGRDGPVLIDWTNAARGKPGTDIAMTWMLLSTGEAPASPVLQRVVAGFRKWFVQSFLRTVDRAAAVEAMPYAFELHLCDPNLTESERKAVTDLVRSVTDG